MNYRNLGNTAIEISEIGLGTWAFGAPVYGGVEEGDAIQAVHAALDAGINPDSTFPEGHINARYTRQELEERCAYVDALGYLVRDDVKTLPQAAMRWVLDDPTVSTVLTGARNTAEVLDCAQAAALTPYTMEEYQRSWDMHTKDYPAA